MMHDRMSRGPHAFRKSDLERALKAAKAAGYTVVTIDAKTGTVTAHGRDGLHQGRKRGFDGE
jgi:hypothetical protein